MLHPNMTPHPEQCAVCFEDNRPCTWYAFESNPRAKKPVCNQCPRRNLKCELPVLPATDESGNIVVDASGNNPYVGGDANETDAARRIRVGSWDKAPDKPVDAKDYTKWREDLFIWRNRVNIPLPPHVPVPPAPNPRPRPPPKTPKGPKEASLSGKKTTPIKIPETPPPFVTPSTQPLPPPIPPAVPVPKARFNVVVEVEPSLPGTPPADPVAGSSRAEPATGSSPSYEDVIKSFVEKYGDDANGIWFAEKIDLDEHTASKR